MCTYFFIGRPGVDYPVLSAIPYTNFYCDEQPYPGFFADMETRCQGSERKRAAFVHASICIAIQLTFQLM